MQPPAPPPSEAPPPPPSDFPPATPSSKSAASADVEADLQPAFTVPAQRKKSIPKKDIPSMEELVKKSEKARAALARPIYLNKAQRDAIDRKKQEEKEALHAKIYGSGENPPLDLEASVRAKFGKKFLDGFAKDPAKFVRNGYGPGNPPLEYLRQNGDHPSNIPTGPRSQRHADVPTEPAAMRSDHTIAANDNKGVKRPTDEELDVDAIRIKQRYMGSDMKESKFSAQKKRKRTTEKRFSFEWNPEDDTTVDVNPIYQDRIQASFFGRGRLAGYDDNMAEAKAQEYAQLLIERDKETGPQRAAELLKMEERRKQLSRRTAIDKHWSEKNLEEMRERDWRIFKEDFNISTKSVSGINPMRNWAESGLGDEILNIVKQVGYDEPTPVQRACIPIALCSRDLIGVAVTGSGKTAAFILPLLVYIRSLPPIEKYNAADGPYAIVLAPTRELAQQIETEGNKFAAPLGMNCISIVGGHSIEEQAFKLRDGASIIIATPGRLVDCLERRVLVLSQCCYVVMDEADRMVDMGFEEPVNKILDALPVANEKPDSDIAENPKAMSVYLGEKERYRQTMMYTATMPPAVERIAKRYLRRPAAVQIGNTGEAVDTVEQRVEFIPSEEKRKKRLEEILNSGEFKPPIIVFVNIKRNCDVVAKDVKHMGYSSISLHGSKSQDQREAALASLRNGTTDVLVATDLAGRGIDVQDVSLVVNFNMATSIEQYTHRIGRTGRAGKTGVAITFLGNEDTESLYDLRQMIAKSKVSRMPPELRDHPAAKQKPGKGPKKIET